MNLPCLTLVGNTSDSRKYSYLHPTSLSEKIAKNGIRSCACTSVNSYVGLFQMFCPQLLLKLHSL